MTTSPTFAQRGEQRAARTYHHAGRAAADEVPLVVALARTHARMHDGHRCRRSVRGSADRSAGVSDISGTSTHAVRPAARRRLDGLQVHLGLARARDAVHDHHVARRAALARRIDGAQRLRPAQGERRLPRGNMGAVEAARRSGVVGDDGRRPSRRSEAGGSALRHPRQRPRPKPTVSSPQRPRHRTRAGEPPRLRKTRACGGDAR